MGFEIRDVESLREHYALMLKHWIDRLEAHHDEACQATNESTYRTWRLYMAGAAEGFECGVYNMYQTLLVKPGQGRSGFAAHAGRLVCVTHLTIFLGKIPSSFFRE